MWFRNKAHEYLYSLSWDEQGYTFLVTNLASVFKEQLGNAEIERRGEELGLPLALSTPQQISALLSVLSEILESGENISFSENAVVVSAATSGIDFSWQFQTRPLPHEESAAVLGQLVGELYGAVANLGEQLSQQNSTIYEKNLVIAGVDDAMRRRIEYRPPKHLEKAFKDRSSEGPEPEDPVLLAAKYWGAGHEPLLVANEEGSDADSDATRDSLEVYDDSTLDS